MRVCCAVLVAGIALSLVRITAVAQTAPPGVTAVSRIGAQRGSTVTVNVTGTNLGGAREVLWTGKGIQAVVKQAAPAPQANASATETVGLAVTVDAGAAPGLRQFRLVTPLGVTNAMNFFVGNLPEAEEREAGPESAAAQEVSPPVTINGRIDPALDVDRYRFAAAAGQRLLFAITAQPLGSALDSALVLRNAAGEEIAANGDADDLDSLLSHTFAAAGEYTVEIRDLTYGGGPSYVYRLTVGAVPLVRALFPAGGAAGETVQVSPLGENLVTSAMPVAVPRDAPPGPILLFPGPGANTGRAVPFWVSDSPEALEREPNDDPKQAQPLALPQTINGRLLREGSKAPDVDHFRFPARQGERWMIEVAARRLGSTLDPVVEVLTAAGKPVPDARSDDAGGALGRDARLEFSPPADGEYVIRLRDLVDASGERAIYRLTLSRARPGFTLSVATANVAVTRGAGMTIPVTASRLSGFDGEIEVTLLNPPPGVTVIPGRIFAGTYKAAAGPIPFPANTLIGLIAAGDAPLGAAAVKIVGTAMVEGKRVSQEARLQDATRTGAPGGRTVDEGCVAVTEFTDVTIAETPGEIRLKPGEKMELKVTVKRREGFKERVTLAVLGLPPGVTAAAPQIAAEKTEATITLTAAADAPSLTRTIYLGARSNPAGVTVPNQTTPPITLTLAP